MKLTPLPNKITETIADHSKAFITTPTFEHSLHSSFDSKMQQQSPLSIEDFRKLISNIDGQLLDVSYMTPRNLCLSLVGKIGLLATSHNDHVCNMLSPAPSSDSLTDKQDILALCIIDLIRISDACAIDLPLASCAKIQLNAKKYPEKLVKGKAGKYTEYMHETGINKKNQSTEMALAKPVKDAWSSDYTFLSIQKTIHDFVVRRDWEKYHQPRNIVLALIAEVGELCELFQWKGDTEGVCDRHLPGWSSSERDKVSQELADVFNYMLRLADVSGQDLQESVSRALLSWQAQLSKPL